MIGVLTGAHCLGMCGGIMLTQNNALMYNGTRLISYTIVGAVFGAMGTVISYDTEFKSQPSTDKAMQIQRRTRHCRAAHGTDAMRSADGYVDVCCCLRLLEIRGCFDVRIRNGDMRAHDLFRNVREIHSEEV